jgi:hypothetical protein
MKNRTGAYLRLHAMREAAMAAFAKNLAAGVNCGRGASGIVHGSSASPTMPCSPWPFGVTRTIVRRPRTQRVRYP